MRTPQAKDQTHKKYLKHRTDYKRMQFYADKETLRDLKVIEGFYSEMLGGSRHSLSIVLRRAVKTQANQIREISSQEGILAFLRLGGGGGNVNG